MKQLETPKLPVFPIKNILGCFSLVFKEDVPAVSDAPVVTDEKTSALED